MVGVLMTRTFDKVTKKSAKVDSTFSFYLMHAFLTDPQLKMMQSIADAEQPFGSGRIELAPSIQPFHICLLLLLLNPILFLLLNILHLLRIPYRLAKLYMGYMALGYIARHTWLYSHWLFSHVYMAI